MDKHFLPFGTIAPAIRLHNQDGKERSLHDFKGQKLIVFLYSKAGSGTCLNEVLSMKEGYSQLKKAGYEVLGVGTDKAKSLKNAHSKHAVPFDLLSDPDHRLLEAFGAWGDKIMFGKPAVGIYRSTFILDENSTISHIVHPVISKQHAAQLLEIVTS